VTKKKFQNYSQPKQFHNDVNVTETIRNLSTTKLEHQIRIILIVQNQSFTDEVKTLTSRSKLLKLYFHLKINKMNNT
jgi:hypothetical protein